MPFPPHYYLSHEGKHRRGLENLSIDTRVSIYGGTVVQEGFPDSSVGKESTCDAGDAGLIPGSRRSPGKGTGNPLQYSFLENPMDRGAWRATVRGIAKSQA